MLSAAALPSSACSCSDATTCQAVASGNVSLSGSVLRDTLTIVGTLPPNPYNSLRGVSADSLTCRSGGLPCCSALQLRVQAKGVNPSFRSQAKGVNSREIPLLLLVPNSC